MKFNFEKIIVIAIRQLAEKQSRAGSTRHPDQLGFLAMTLFFLFAFFIFPKSALAAKFTLSPDTKTVESGDQYTVDVYLDTEGKTINSADLQLTYPQSIIWVDSVEYPSTFPFHVQQIIKNDGKVIFHFGANSQSTRFNGNSLVAKLYLSTHSAGTGYLNFVCDNSNDSDDTNIWEADTGNDIVNCGGQTRGLYYITAKIGGTVVNPACSRPPEPKNVKAVSGPQSGQIILTWDAVSSASYYTLTYGLTSKGYSFGASNLGTATSYTVGNLTPGRRYYFVLTTVNACDSSGYSAEVSAKAQGVLLATETTCLEKGCFTPGEVVSFSPNPGFTSDEATQSGVGEEATESGLFSATPSAQPSTAPFVPPARQPFWQNWSFWAKALGLSAVLFLILLIGSYIFNKMTGGGDQPPEAQPQEPIEETPSQPEVQPQEIDQTQTQWPPQQPQQFEQPEQTPSPYQSPQNY